MDGDGNTHTHTWVYKIHSQTNTQDIFYVDVIKGFDQHHSPISEENLDDGDDERNP
jgi:hypothetical protein